MDPRQQIKAAIDRLQALPEEEWEAFAAQMTLKRYAKGVSLTEEGQVENHIYFLNSGATRHYFIRDGKEFTVDFQFAGDFVTAYYSLITREPSTVFISVLEEVEAWVISRNTLQHFYERSRYGERIGRLIAEEQYVKRLRKEMALRSLTAEERYTALMAKDPALVANISVKHLSSYLGVQPESLSRIRKQYRKS
ncbi:Crp/Fnr family transcriptional regulator [Taibaiella koreensis]|uniref:Crp/Fnr family transcriptional regulator n=1 Tax=Taibaiella koreensis TaxID=1268548 RepID=UPI000E59D606|nr:Crp/Fnr family transcriptional regulator [Taibaiella koreensis]